MTVIASCGLEDVRAFGYAAWTSQAGIVPNTQPRNFFCMFNHFQQRVIPR